MWLDTVADSLTPAQKEAWAAYHQQAVNRRLALSADLISALVDHELKLSLEQREAYRDRLRQQLEQGNWRPQSIGEVLRSGRIENLIGFAHQKSHEIFDGLLTDQQASRWAQITSNYLSESP